MNGQLETNSFSLLVIFLLSDCAPAIPPPNPRLDVNTKRLPVTVLLLSNLQDNYRFYREVKIDRGSGRNRVRGTQTRIIDVGKSSHHLFVTGLTHLFDKVLTIGQEAAEQDYDYQLIPSIAYDAYPGKHGSCGTRVRNGALLRHRDGRALAFDSGWFEVNASDPKAIFYDQDVSRFEHFLNVTTNRSLASSVIIH